MNLITDVQNKLKEWYRVLRVTKKPENDELLSVIKVTGAGILLIGIVGLFIWILFALLG